MDEPTTISSADHATFPLGSPANFTVTTTGGYPTPPVLTETGALPPGMTFTDNGDGTATLGGTPTTGGTYPFTITANNGVAPNATQSFTATVNSTPSITSADHTTFAVGSAGTFTVTTNPGTPSTTTLSETGALPSGVTFHDNGDGTATLAGTPAAGSGGSYALTITASNGVLPNSTQAFTLTVTELPAFTSANHATFAVGSAGTFTVTTHLGFPTATTLTEAGSLPSGVTFTDNGDGTATLAGTPAAGSGGSYPLTLTATNTAGHTDQAFTLTVSASPVITSADHTTFAVGSAGSFTVTTSPTATTITESGALPSGVTFHDNGNGTATLAGTPAAGSGGSYALTITASNGVLPNATQAFTLTVTAVPTITSANHATFALGSAGTFTVTTHAGFPTATTLTETGTLPSGVTFTDNGDGTATLAGTPTTVGSYPLTLTATNTVGHTDQAFTLTVSQSPTITSADHTTFTVNTSGTFTVTTSGGFPTPPALTETGALPSGVTFHDNGNGTATLSGTPTVGGTFAITITANNGVAPAVNQSFTLTVNGPPVITSANIVTFTAGLPGLFKVTTQSSTGTVTLKETGTLPKFVLFVDNHNGTGYLLGIPLPNTVGTYHITITATNGVGSTTQAFTLLIKKATVITLPTTLPPSSGVLGGVPTQTTQGQVLHLNGGGFAAGAPLTIGYYTGAKVLGYSLALPNGDFLANIQTSVLGSHTFVVAGIGSNGQTRYLEATANTVHGQPPCPPAACRLPVTVTGCASPGRRRTCGSLARYGLAAILAGLALIATPPPARGVLSLTCPARVTARRAGR